MSKSFIPFLIFILSLAFLPGKAQQPSIYEGLSLKANLGLASFHGDITKNPYGSLSDAKLGLSVAAIKMFNPAIGIQVRYFSGYLAATRLDIDEKYTGQIAEVGLSLRIEPVKQMGPNGPRKIYPYFQLGISSASFRAIRWTASTNLVIPPTFGYELDNLTHGPKENALSIPIGIGFGYRASEKLSFEFEHTNSFTNSDYVDAFAGEGKYNDNFGFTNVGIRYRFGTSSGSNTSLNKSARTSTTKSPRTSNKRVRDDRYDESLKQEEIGAIDPFVMRIPNTNIFVESQMPANPVSGRIFEVNLRVHKNDYTGEATINQTFPNGFTVIETPLRHAILEFVNQRLKISWTQMPLDSIITVKYHVHVDESIQGKHSIPGYISYFQAEGSNNYQFENHIYVDNRKEADMDTGFLDIANGVKTGAENNENALDLSDPLGNMSKDELDRKIELLLQANQKTATPVATTQYPKIQVPNYKISEAEMDNRIVDIIEGNRYGKRDPSKSVYLSKPVNIGTEEELDRKIKELIVQNNEGGNPNSSKQYNTRLSSSYYQAGVEYRIQVGTFRSRGKEGSLIRKYNIREPLIEEYHNGMYKYTVGSLRTYEEAKRWRDSFINRTNLESVFIVAYRDGSRLNNISEARR